MSVDSFTRWKCRALMGMTPTQLYSVPEVCKAAQSLLDIHGEVGQEEIPMAVQALGVRIKPFCSSSLPEKDVPIVGCNIRHVSINPAPHVN